VTSERVIAVAEIKQVIVKGQGKLNARIIFESVLMLYAYPKLPKL